MRRWLYFILPALFVLTSARAIEGVQSHSVFYLSDPVYQGKLNPYMESYWQVNPRTIHFNTTADKNIVARLKTDVLITNDTGKVIKEDHYIYQTRPVANANELGLLNIMELKRYLITEGKMKMVLTLTDLNDTNNHIRFIDTFTVAISPKEPFFAGPELIDTIYESDVRSPFRKHGKQYIPMCIPFVDDYQNSLGYYAEMYYGENIPSDAYPLTRSIFISKKQLEDPYAKYTRIDTIKSFSPDSNYVSGVFNINNLPSGNYYISVMLGDRFHRTLTSKSVFFQRANKHQTKEDLAIMKAAADTGMENVTFLNLSKTFVAKFDVGQLKAILKMMLPVSDAMGAQAIQGFLKKPDEMYMRYFIYNYFQSVNKKDPGKAWKEFAVEIKEVNKLFNTSTTAGYETDRGKMYLRYGAPSEIVTVENESGTLPYEIWQYNTLKEKTGKEVANAMMLFYKKSETTITYTLLHTTIQGEIHNIGWRSFLYVTPEGGNNLNSRAEQYLGQKDK